MDKRLIRQRFARAASTYPQEATVQHHVAHRLASLVKRYVPVHGHCRVWEVGCGTGLFTRAYLQTQTPDELWLNDICPEVEKHLAPFLAKHIHFHAGDAELAEPPQNVSLITSCSALQWFEQPLHFLHRCHQALAPNGYVAIATFGPDNFHELRSLTGASLSYRTLDNWQNELHALGYTVVHAAEEHNTIYLSTPIEVLRHLKQTGVTGIHRQSWTKERLAVFNELYKQRFAKTDGQVPLTYHPIYLLIQKQPQQ